jgi:hypothetical protein
LKIFKTNNFAQAGERYRSLDKTHSLEGVKNFLTSNVMEKVVRYSRVPVMVIQVMVIRIMVIRGTQALKAC